MKNILKIAGILILIGLIAGIYMYNKPHKSIIKSKADFEVDAYDLFRQFSENEEEANAKFLDKLVTVTGTIAKIDNEGENTTISLAIEDEMFAVSCELDPHYRKHRTDWEEGKRVTLKGICAGSTMDVVLVRCVEIKENQNHE